MIRSISGLAILLLISISSYSQVIPIQQIISNGDTAYIVPLWRIVNANNNFIQLSKALEVNREQNNLINFKNAKLDAQKNELRQVKLERDNFKEQGSTWELKYNNQAQQTDIKDIEIKDYKKKVRILKFTIAGVSIVAGIVIIAALIGG